MKNLLSLLLLAFVSTSVFAQGIIERNYSQYIDQQDVTHVYISGKLFDMAAVVTQNMEDEDVRELSDFASKIESFSLIKVPNLKKAEAEYQKGLSDIDNDYEELLRMRDDGERFVVYVNEEDDVVYEIVGLGVVDGEFIALSLVGEMDLNKISEFISKADNDMFQPLKRLENINPEEMKVYPNPASTSANFNLEVPEKLIGGTATIYDANGNKIKSIKVAQKRETIPTQNLTPGNYLVEISNSTLSMKKQLIVVQ